VFDAGAGGLLGMSVHPHVIRNRTAETAAFATDANFVVPGVMELRVQDGVVLPHGGLLV
jgi:hypothetical protein